MKFNKWTLGLLGLAMVGGAMALDAFFGLGHAATGGVLCATGAPLLVMPKNSKDAEGVRSFLTNVKQLCSTASVYEGPLRQMFEDLRAKLEAALSALPTSTDANWSVNDQADQLFSLLGCANNVAAALGLELNKVKQEMAGMVVLDTVVAEGAVIKKDAVQGMIEAAIAERTGEKGDLTTKLLAQQLCSAAKQEGVAEGIAQRNAELATQQAAIATANERKTALTTAGLPLPEAEVENILSAEPAVFDAAKTAAEDRLKKFTEAGVRLPENLRGKVWLGEAGFNTFKSMVESIPELKKPMDEPLASGPTAPGGGGKIIV